MPEALVAEAVGVVGVLILPLHGAEAPDGESAEGEFGPLLPLFVPDLGAHADGKLVDGDAAQPRGDKVAPLVGGDQYSKQENGDNNIHGLTSLLGSSSAAPRAAGYASF